MSGSINNPSSMLAAQMISYAKGQENQTRFSGEERERKRLENQKLQQEATHQKTQKQTASLQKGILA